MTAKQARILIIEDDASLRLGLEQGFASKGYEVETAARGDEGLDAALSGGADLIVLDLMLPGLDGFEILRRIRADRLETPVIVLTALGEEEDRIRGFECGADDYVVKPFSVKELLLRAAAVLRRTAESGPLRGEAVIGGATVDFRGYQIRRGSRKIGLSRKEAEMLRLFVDNPGVVIERRRFLEAVWGYQSYPTTRTVDMHVLKLRQKIESDPENPRHIITIHGVGYKFVP